MVSVPADRLPALLRATPTTAIRLHLSTHARLEGLRLADESWDSFIWRTILLPRAYAMPAEPRPHGPRRRKVAPDADPPQLRPERGLAAQEQLLPLGSQPLKGETNGSGTA